MSERPQNISLHGLCRIDRCRCGTFRLTVGPVTLSVSEDALDHIHRAVQDALIQLEVERSAASATERHLSVVAHPATEH